MPVCGLMLRQKPVGKPDGCDGIGHDQMRDVLAAHRFDGFAFRSADTRDDENEVKNLAFDTADKAVDHRQVVDVERVHGDVPMIGFISFQAGARHGAYRAGDVPAAFQ